MKHLAANIKLSSLNGHLICGLCGGYLIDATVISECVHVFCRSCIVKYLTEHKVCPLCQSLIQENRPGQALKPDIALQRIVYKLVPGLLRTELQRMTDFCLTPVSSPIVEPDHDQQSRAPSDEFFHPPLPVALATRSLTKSPSALPSASNTSRSTYPTDKLPISMTFLIGNQELLSVSLTYLRASQSDVLNTQHLEYYPTARPQLEKPIFILCPAVVNVSTLHQLLLAKYQLDPCERTVDIYLDGECLEPSHSLREVVFLYHFPARKQLMELEFIFADPHLAWWGQPMPRLEPTEKAAFKSSGWFSTKSSDDVCMSTPFLNRPRARSISDDERLCQNYRNKLKRMSV